MEPFSNDLFRFSPLKQHGGDGQDDEGDQHNSDDPHGEILLMSDVERFSSGVSRAGGQRFTCTWKISLLVGLNQVTPNDDSREARRTLHQQEV
ncbi:MAG: hypothetical protein NTNFB02_34110 [Nitrospira sp.]